MSRKAEWVVYLLLILIGGLYFYAAFQYSLGEATNPGPGLMPRILGVVFVALAGYLLLGARLSHKSHQEMPKEKEGRGQEGNTPLWVTITLIAYTATLNFLGFALGSLLVVFILGKVMGLEGWKKSMVLSMGVVVCAQLLFGFALDVPLPKGAIWGR
jgi:hypothetical protein